MKTKEQLAKELQSYQNMVVEAHLTTGIEQYNIGSFEGYKKHKKETNKILLDTLNLYRSRLSNEQRVKLTKIVSEEKIMLLKSQIEVIIEIQNKLK